MNWIKIRTLKPDMIHWSWWEGPVEDPWKVAEDCMKQGFLPPVVLCVLLPQHNPQVFTRQKHWVLAGAVETLNRVEEDAAALRKELRKIKRPYEGNL